jgi:hypothetical protein
MTAQTIAPDGQRTAATAAPSTSQPTMADPTPIAFCLFAFALVVYGIRFVSVSSGTLVGPTSFALNYALLAAGIAQAIVGFLAVIRGMTYRGWVTAIFGVWLIGFYLLLTHVDMTPVERAPAGDAKATAVAHATVTAWHADSVAWFVLALIVPVAILAVPSFVHRNVPFMIAFVAILVLLLLLGLSFLNVYNEVTDATKGGHLDLSNAVSMLKVSAWCAFAGAVAIWWVFARDVYQMTGVQRGPAR